MAHRPHRDATRYRYRIREAAVSLSRLASRDACGFGMAAVSPALPGPVAVSIGQCRTDWQSLLHLAAEAWGLGTGGWGLRGFLHQVAEAFPVLACRFVTRDVQDRATMFGQQLNHFVF